VFASTLRTEAPGQVSSQLLRAGVPQSQIDQVAGQFAGSGFTLDDLSAVGDMGARILAGIPEEFRSLVEPLIPSIVGGIHEAFSLAIANTMWLGVLAALVALAATLGLREVALRSSARAPGAQATPPVGAEAAATD
jgi:hypothetical protein